jgi:hypothetical protein
LIKWRIFDENGTRCLPAAAFGALRSFGEDRIEQQMRKEGAGFHCGCSDMHRRALAISVSPTCRLECQLRSLREAVAGTWRISASCNGIASIK